MTAYAMMRTALAEKYCSYARAVYNAVIFNTSNLYHFTELFTACAAETVLYTVALLSALCVVPFVRCAYQIAGDAANTLKSYAVACFCLYVIFYHLKNLFSQYMLYNMIILLLTNLIIPYIDINVH